MLDGGTQPSEDVLRAPRICWLLTLLIPRKHSQVLDTGMSDDTDP